eukprot:SM000084S23144  [mRNA]  locus=s84:315684:316334:- [translate_table: standard]
MEVAEEDLEVLVRGTLEGLVEGRVVEEDWEEEDWRAEVMEVAMEGVGRGAEVTEVSEEKLEVVERGTQERLVEELIEAVEEKVGWTEVMEVAVKDLEVVERGTLGVVVEEEEVGLGAQLEDCEGEGERLEVMEVGVIVRES